MGNTDQGATIFVVDDTPANLALLSGMLQERGYRVRVFPRGRLALAAASKEPPELILLDINMPEMDGYDVCRHLKADAALRDIPVLFISALSDTQDKVTAFAVGGVDYVTKPFQFEEVEARVRTHLALYRYQHHLQDLVQDQVREIADSQMSTIFALAKLAESRDDDTGQHLERVQEFCKLLAQQLCATTNACLLLPPAFIDNLYHASPLHDIGKVGIADTILLKPGKLTPEEFAIMKQHSVIGAQTLDAASERYPRNTFINMGAAIARSHHEKWDGSGYPNGLTGEAIPLEARIMAVADVYDALRSKRCYKDAFTHEKSRDIIMAGRGTHFDPAIVEAFVGVEQDFDRIRTAMDDDA
jgi:putative two-component system response regulator